MLDQIISLVSRYLSYPRSTEESINQRRMSASIHLRKALDSLSQNIMCSSDLCNMVEEALMLNPVHHKPVKKRESRLKEKRHTTTSYLNNAKYNNSPAVRKPDESVSPLSSPDHRRKKSYTFWE